MVPGHSQVRRCTTRWIWLGTRENSGVDLQTRSYQRCDSFSAFDKQNISLNGQPNGLETQMARLTVRSSPRSLIRVLAYAWFTVFPVEIRFLDTRPESSI